MRLSVRAGRKLDARDLPDALRTGRSVLAGPPRILLADDYAIFRQGLKGLLEHEKWEVVAEVGDGREAVRLTQELSPNVAILDLAMPLLDGAGAAEEISRITPQTRTILLTMHSEEPYIISALQAGIKGMSSRRRAPQT